MRVLLGLVGLGLAWLVWADREREAFALLMVVLALLFGLVCLQGVAGLPSVLRQAGVRRLLALAAILAAWVVLWQIVWEGKDGPTGVVGGIALMAIAIRLWPREAPVLPAPGVREEAGPTNPAISRPAVYGGLMGGIAVGVLAAAATGDLLGLCCAPLGAPFGAMVVILLGLDREEGNEPDKAPLPPAAERMYDRDLNHGVVRR